MSIYDKRREEQKREKAGRIQSVLSHAIAVLLDKGIAGAKMTDVAEHAQVGIASLYRYFKTKQEMVILTAEYYWETEINSFFEVHPERYDKKGSELGYIRHLMELYLELFDNHPEILRFIEDFDAFIAREAIPEETLKNYDHIVRHSEGVLTAALKEARENELLRKDLEIERFSHTALITLRGLGQKYVSRPNLIPSDTRVNGRQEISLMIDILMEYITEPKENSCHF